MCSNSDSLCVICTVQLFLFGFRKFWLKFYDLCLSFRYYLTLVRYFLQFLLELFMSRFMLSYCLNHRWYICLPLFFFISWKWLSRDIPSREWVKKEENLSSYRVFRLESNFFGFLYLYFEWLWSSYLHVICLPRRECSITQWSAIKLREFRCHPPHRKVMYMRWIR